MGAKKHLYIPLGTFGDGAKIGCFLDRTNKIGIFKRLVAGSYRSQNVPAGKIIIKLSPRFNSPKGKIKNYGYENDKDILGLLLCRLR